LFEVGHVISSNELSLSYFAQKKERIERIFDSRCNRGSLKTKLQCDHADTGEYRAIELGHCFLLGDRYTKAFNVFEGTDDCAENRT